MKHRNKTMIIQGYNRKGVRFAQGMACLLILALCYCCAPISPTATPSISLECCNSAGEQIFDLPIHVASASEPTEGSAGAWSLILNISEKSAKDIARYQEYLEHNEARICIQDGPRSELAYYINPKDIPVLGAYFSSRDAAESFRKRLRPPSPPE